jgi:peptidoglycan/LPS O-acetylase OafA/YrhL
LGTNGARVDLKPLTSLRFFAALLVFAYHAPVGRPFAAEHALGQAGVGFFFLLSGFILTYRYHDALTGAAADVREFYAARLARIYPTYLAAMAIALLVTAAVGAHQWDVSTPLTRIVAVIAHTIAVQAWLPSEQLYFGVNSPAWSISVEAFFYALFPFLIRSFSRSFAASSAQTILLAAVVTWAAAAAAFSIPHPAEVWSTYVFPPVRIVDFVVGMLLGFAFVRGYRLWGPATMWEIGAIACVAAGIVVLPIFPVPVALKYGLFLMPLWALLIAVVALRTGAVSRALSHPVLERLGEISFAFYLVHLSALTAFERVGRLTGVTASLAAFVCALALSFALYHGVEQPMRRRIKKWLTPSTENRNVTQRWNLETRPTL